MKTEALQMPQAVQDLILLALNRMGIQKTSVTDDVLAADIYYEYGTELSILILCVVQRKLLFKNKPAILVSISQRDRAGQIEKVFDQDFIPYPRSANDLPFVIRLSAKIKTLAWYTGQAYGFGPCLTFVNENVAD